MLVNTLVLLLLYQWIHLPLILASAMAVELAIINNFIWNNRWTFGCSQISCKRFARFNLVSLAGLIVSTGALWVLVSRLGLYYLAANLLGIALATAWNFSASSLWAWGGER
jgi:putative flippase GtrA